MQTIKIVDQRHKVVEERVVVVVGPRQEMAAAGDLRHRLETLGLGEIPVCDAAGDHHDRPFLGCKDTADMAEQAGITNQGTELMRPCRRLAGPVAGKGVVLPATIATKAFSSAENSVGRSNCLSSNIVARPSAG